MKAARSKCCKIFLQVVRSCQVISHHEAGVEFVCRRGLSANNRFVRDSYLSDCAFCVLISSEVRSIVTHTLRKKLTLAIVITSKRSSHKNS